MADLDFSVSKKKKKTKVSLLNEEHKIVEDVVLADFFTVIDFTNKKKKRKAAFIVEDEDDLDLSDDGDVLGNTDYIYDEMLERIFQCMSLHNPDLMHGERRKLVMQPPALARIGTKKTLYSNFQATINQIHRDAPHVMQYLLNEMGTTGSLDQNSQLLIKGRYQTKHLESILKNYCRSYVICKTCSAADTVLSKETRLLFLNCKACGSRYSVDSHSAGYQAVTTKRAAIRAKAQ